MAEDREDEQGGGFNSAYVEYDSMTLVQLGQAMEEVRAQLDAAKEVKTALEKRYDFLCSVKIPPAMEDSGLQNFRLESGRGVRVQDEVFVSLNAENFPPFRAWLQEQGDEAIIKETINSATLKAYIVGRIKAGKEYPMDKVKVTLVPKARFF